MRRNDAVEAFCELMGAFQNGFPKCIYAGVLIVENELPDNAGIQQGKAKRGASGENLYEGVQLIVRQLGIQVVDKFGFPTGIAKRGEALLQFWSSREEASRICCALVLQQKKKTMVFPFCFVHISEAFTFRTPETGRGGVDVES